MSDIVSVLLGARYDGMSMKDIVSGLLGEYFVPLCVPVDGWGSFGRMVLPGRIGMVFQFENDSEIEVRFGTSPDGRLESCGFAVAPGNVNGPANKSIHEKLMGGLRAVGMVDLTIGPKNGTLYLSEHRFHTVPRFVPDVEFGFPLPPAPKVRVSQAGYETMIAWLRKTLPRSGDYEWSGRKDPKPVKLKHPFGENISFTVGCPPSVSGFKYPTPSWYDVSWHGSRGWSIGGGPPVKTISLEEAISRAMAGVTSAIAPESFRERWWSNFSVETLLLERFAGPKEMYDLLAEPNPMLWSDERFHAWTQEGR